MSREEVYCGLDIGSGRITGVIGKYDPEQQIIEIIAGRQITDRNAINVGIIKDIEKSARLINEIIMSLEDMAKLEKTRIIVGVRGPFISTYDTSAQIPITSTDRTITEEDKYKVIDHAIKNLRIPNDKTIMRILAQEYIIDGQPGINNPVNMEGSVLEVRAHAVVVYSSFIRNIEKTFSQASYIIDSGNDIQYGLIPTSYVITDNEEKNMGCIVIDFSGQSIGVVIYKDGCIRYSKEFYWKNSELGADLITREIAAYYKTSWNIAEDIKKRYGFIPPSLIKKDEQIEIPSRDGKNFRISTKKELARIIAEVVETIFLDYLIPELKKIELVRHVLEDGDIVLTGGGANLGGITNAIKQLFQSEFEDIENDIEVRPGSIGIENNIIGNEEIISDFSYTTAISLIKSEVDNLQEYYQNRTHERGIKGLFKRIWRMFE